MDDLMRDDRELEEDEDVEDKDEDDEEDEEDPIIPTNGKKKGKILPPLIDEDVFEEFGPGDPAEETESLDKLAEDEDGEWDDEESYDDIDEL